jgi:hypothetical protein
MAKDRKAYKAWYYQTKVKPFRKQKPKTTTKIIYQCPLCRKSSTPQCFSGKFQIKIGVLKYEGYKGINYENVSTKHPTYIGKLKDFAEHMAIRATEFVKLCIRQKLANEEEIALILGLFTTKQLVEVTEIWQPKKTNRIEYITKPQTTQSAPNTMSGVTVSSGQRWEQPQSLLSVRRQESATPNYVLKPKII